MNANSTPTEILATNATNVLSISGVVGGGLLLSNLGSTKSVRSEPLLSPSCEVATMELTF
ncbi:MAG TPA: hypothetical protein VJN71_08890 [Nitrososphaerales archaeon]|nr:hypothetical protein [Nitrososphaerales archaeon]